MKATVQKYASYAILLALLGLGATTVFLWHGKHVRDAQIKDLTQSNIALSDNLTAERAWSASLSAELLNRQHKQVQNDQAKERVEQKLEKSYEANPGWADAPVPDDIADGLRDYIGKATTGAEKR